LNQTQTIDYRAAIIWESRKHWNRAAIDFPGVPAKNLAGGERKLVKSEYINRFNLTCFIAVGAVCALLCGCGNIVLPGAQLKVASDCDVSELATDLIVLNWSGGTSDIYPDDDFPGIEFSAFETIDGGTLADDPEAFKGAVEAEVRHILCELPSVNISMRNEKERIDADVTTVFIVQAPSQAGEGQIGEGEFDPCNLHDDDSALVFGSELADLSGPYSFEDWVRIFANVTAHEIGHTLGFNHVPRSESGESEHRLFVELMLAGHTIDEMIRPQRFLSDNSNCPDDPHDHSKNVHSFTCGLSD